jgi:hypothetical protein
MRMRLDWGGFRSVGLRKVVVKEGKRAARDTWYAVVVGSRSTVLCHLVLTVFLSSTAFAKHGHATTRQLELQAAGHWPRKEGLPSCRRRDEPTSSVYLSVRARPLDITTDNTRLYTSTTPTLHIQLPQ